ATTSILRSLVVSLGLVGLSCRVFINDLFAIRRFGKRNFLLFQRVEAQYQIHTSETNTKFVQQ
ncbi:MAG: hypothetical protein DRG71_03135, partial [Deltaproteobacteria bacterium]